MAEIINFERYRAQRLNAEGRAVLKESANERAAIAELVEDWPLRLLDLASTLPAGSDEQLAVEQEAERWLDVALAMQGGPRHQVG